MDSFFADTRPGREVTHGEATFELPILYLRDDCFGLYFTADLIQVRDLMPSDRLHPVTMPNGRAVVVVLAWNYIDTSVGPYGEVPVGIPVVFGRKPLPFTGIIPALLESHYPGFGILVMHLPVTKILARDAGRGEWGYTKFIADMRFNITPEYLECQMFEENEHILDLRVVRRGIHIRESKPLVTFSVKDNRLIKTVIDHKGMKRLSPFTKGSFLRLGNHPMAQSLRDLGLSPQPMLSIYYTERAAILPSGEVVEDGVRAFGGYIGKTRSGKHTVEYTPYGF